LKLKIGITSIENAKYFGCLSTSITHENMKIIGDSVQENRFLTPCMLANEVGIPCGSCQSIQNVNMQHAVTKIVPYLLTDEWK
jgi:hypothetical protein